MCPPPDKVSQKPRLRGVIHQWSAVIAFMLGVLLVSRAEAGTARYVSVIYALSLVGLLAVSATYHRVNWRSTSARMWMRRLDHAMIFVLIAGSYTPFALLVLDGQLAKTVLIVVWLGAGFGTIMQVLWATGPKWVSAIVYIALGWAVVATFPDIFHRLGLAPGVLLFAGGILYTLGALVYARHWPNPVPATFGYHEIFHTLVVVAATMQYIVIAFWVVPYTH